MNEIELKIIKEVDLAEVARIHINAVPESALTKLGHEVVCRYYLRQLTRAYDCYAVAASKNGKLLGFCFGGIFHGALSDFLRINKKFLIKQVFLHPWLLANQIFRDRLIIALHSLKVLPAKKNKPTTSVIKENSRSFSILSIAVDPFTQSRGVGRILMQAAEKKAIEKGFNQMDLSVNPKNLQAINFYLGLGWVKKGDPWAGSMIKNLAKK